MRLLGQLGPRAMARMHRLTPGTREFDRVLDFYDALLAPLRMDMSPYGIPRPMAGFTGEMVMECARVGPSQLSRWSVPGRQPPSPLPVESARGQCQLGPVGRATVAAVVGRMARGQRCEEPRWRGRVASDPAGMTAEAARRYLGRGRDVASIQASASGGSLPRRGSRG